MERVTFYRLEEDFICKLADFIATRYLSEGKDINKLVFVFPGKRPALFLTQELSRRIKKSFLPPVFFSIDEFIEYAVSKHQPYRRISDLDACYRIYELARNVAPTVIQGRKTFAQFLPWAKEILSFIESLDLEDIQEVSLKNIQEKAHIGYDVPPDINALLQEVVSLRRTYHRYLNEEGMYSRGLLYLRASELISGLSFEEFDHFFFCGFFYLHRTQQRLLQQLYEAGKATLFFQGNPDEWSVLEENARVFSTDEKMVSDKAPASNLHLYRGFDVHSQIGLVREILKGSRCPDKTAIVLPDPHAIIPLVSEIASVAPDFNISMGYPLQRSSLYSLFDCIFKVQASKKIDTYYSPDYLKALSHPLVKNLKLFSHPSLTRVLVHKIEEILVGIEKTGFSGSLFVRLGEIEESRELYDVASMLMKKMGLEVSRKEIHDTLSVLHEFLFRCWEPIETFADFSVSIEKLVDLLMNKSFLGAYPLNLKMAQKVLELGEELGNAACCLQQLPQEDIFAIFQQRMKDEMVSFSGSPLKGLQVLGFLETRLLSFENVIVLDLNESVMPNLKIYEPLIPREVMISLGLNRLEKEEEIQRYQFRRLIACAKEAFLIYQDRQDKEKSRFIEELLWERQKKEGKLAVLPIPKASFSVKISLKRQAVYKTAPMLELLAQREFSATSINTYLHCPLQFYYQYVLGLKEKEDLFREPEGADVGTFIHELLRDTFSRFLGKKPRIDEEFGKAFFALLDKKFADTFQRTMKSDSFLLKEVLAVRMQRFLEKERLREVQEIVCLEKVFKGTIKAAGRSFKCKAIVDRIDRLLDQSILILDYKTGGTSILAENDIEKIRARGFSRESLKSTIKSFQLPLYVSLVKNASEYRASTVNAALYFIKESGDDLGVRSLFGRNDDPPAKAALMELYLQGLSALIAQIMDASLPFKADEEDQRYCSYCSFVSLCR